MGRKPHRITGLFPDMDADAYEALKADIARNGVQEPIVVHGGQILDGRHRDRACRELGMECPAREWDGRNPWLVVQARNLRRRHLSQGQIAAIVEEARRRFPEVAALVDAAKAEARERQAAGQKAGGRGRKKLGGKPSTKFTSSDAVGREIGVSGRTWRRIELVKRSSPDLVSRIKAGGISVDRAVQLAKAEEARQLRSRMIRALPDPSGDHGVLLGDFRKIGGQVPDSSAALVFTDPPYAREFLPLYRDLGLFAARVLAPGGSLVTYAGHVHLPDVLRLVAESGLRYSWIFCALHVDPEQDPAHTNGLARVRGQGVIACFKPLLVFVKERWGHGGFIRDVVYAPREKDLHPWQQPVGVARHFIEAMTEPGDLVVDPFVGSGTTLDAAKELSRRWIGIDKDPEAARVARARLESLTLHATAVR